MQTPTDLVDTRIAARIANAHVSSIYRWILSGRLRGWKKAGSRYYVSRRDVEQIMQEVRPAR